MNGFIYRNLLSFDRESRLTLQQSTSAFYFTCTLSRYSYRSSGLHGFLTEHIKLYYVIQNDRFPQLHPLLTSKQLKLPIKLLLKSVWTYGV